MPTISAFCGISIQMFWQEHAPPHFHALYGELVLEWAAMHRNELAEDWKLCEIRQSPHKIPPLE